MSFFSKLFGGGIQNLNAAELQAQLKEKPAPFLLDVREPSEFASGHIAGARLIPLGELSKRIDELPRDRTIICVCQSGNRSRSAARHLNANGFKVSNLSGGMLAWSWAKLPVKQGRT